MSRVVFLLLAAGLSFVAACSKTESDAKPIAAEPAAKQAMSGQQAMPLDYQKICERLIQLAPEARKGSLPQTCEKGYREVMPACRNAAAVNECFANMKVWDERLACLDSCVRDAGPEKK
ncbi:MAG: hypothetical protein WC073_07460 [Sterolibacterium sp.]